MNNNKKFRSKTHLKCGPNTGRRKSKLFSLLELEFSLLSLNFDCCNFALNAKISLQKKSSVEC